MNAGAVLVTDSAQLAVDWKRRLIAEHSVTETPQICSWQQWLNELAGQHVTLPVPLNALQELELWQRLIASDMAGRLSAASLRGMARHAAAAFLLVRDYLIDPADLTAGGEEGEAFCRWLGRFERLCEESGRMAAADIGVRLLPLVCHRELPDRVILDGFERLSPLQQALLAQCAKEGSRISVLGRVGNTPSITLSSLTDVDDEYRHVAATLRTLLEENPQQRIAIVTAGQPADAARLRRILDDTLLPIETALLPVAEQAVNMAGDSLAGMPLVRQLLQLLALAGNSGASFVDFSRLLFSPAFGGFEAERCARAELDAWLRENKRHYLSFHALLALDQLQGLPRLSAILRSLQAWERAPRRAASWVQAVHGLLKACGCLESERGLSAAEVRQLNGFREVLSSLVAIDAVSESMEWGAFLLLLRERLSATLLALPAHYPQVTVVPLSSMPGLRFDAVLAVGFDEDTLPLPIEAQPLLSPMLARKYGLPQATPELAFAASGFLWDQLRQSTPRLYISYARSRDERVLASSPLLAGIPEQRVEVPANVDAKTEMQLYNDAPPVPLNRIESVRGGTGIIKSQSACPFRAFASYRLGIAPLGEIEPGVDAATKGSLVHLALEYIWERLGSRQALLELDEAATMALIGSAVSSAMGKCRTVMAESAKVHERLRLQHLLGEWLETERQRPAFTVVEREKWFELRLPAEGDLCLPIRLQADRIDRDEAGHTILIDYKTGQKQSSGQWLGERPAEPQLPLYAVAAGLTERDAVCFARVRSGDMGFEGLSGEVTGIERIGLYKGNDEAEAWPDLLVLWRQRLEVLAAEFVQGRCEVAPRDAHACDYCGLEAVCRIDETGFDAEPEEETA